MTSLYGLNDATIRKIHAVLGRYPQVEKAVLYGSRAKGNFKNGSDIDLTLVGGASLTSAVLYKLERELDDLLLPHTIDLSIQSQITNAEVLDHIRRIGVEFYVKQDETKKMKGYRHEVSR